MSTARGCCLRKWRQTDLWERTQCYMETYVHRQRLQSANKLITNIIRNGRTESVCDYSLQSPMPRKWRTHYTSFDAKFRSSSSTNKSRKEFSTYVIGCSPNLPYVKRKLSVRWTISAFRNYYQYCLLFSFFVRLIRKINVTRGVSLVRSTHSVSLMWLILCVSWWINKWIIYAANGRLSHVMCFHVKTRSIQICFPNKEKSVHAVCR